MPFERMRAGFAWMCSIVCDARRRRRSIQNKGGVKNMIYLIEKQINLPYISLKLTWQHPGLHT
jgi:hypothetical protein